MKDTYKLSRAAILYAGVITLLLPCLLFVLGWVRPMFAIPSALMLIISACYCCRNTVRNWNQEYMYCSFSTKDAVKLALTLIGLLLFVDIVGVVGHVQQATDFAVRNAIYSELQKSPWPIFSAKGEYFVYYHSFWLPPALLSKIIPVNISDGLLFVWIYITLSISALTLFTKIKGRVLLFFIIFILGGNIIEILKVIPTLLDRYGTTIPCANSLSTFCSAFAIESHFRYLNVWSQFVYTFNHAVPLVLYTTMILSGLIPVRYILYISALVFSASPLGVAPLLPVLFYIIFKNKAFCCTILRWENWIATLFVLISIVYFCGQINDHTNAVMLWQDYEYWSRVNGTDGAFVNIHVRFLRYTSVALAIISTIWIVTTARIRRSIWFGSFVYLAIILPIIWIGKWNNELLFKGSLVLFMLFAWLLVKQWEASSTKRKIAIIAIVFLSSLHIVNDISRRQLYHYTWDHTEMKKNKRNEWGGTLNKPDNYAYGNFWGVNKFPSILTNAPDKGLIK